MAKFNNAKLQLLLYQLNIYRVDYRYLYISISVNSIGKYRVYRYSKWIKNTSEGRWHINLVVVWRMDVSLGFGGVDKGNFSVLCNVLFFLKHRIKYDQLLIGSEFKYDNIDVYLYFFISLIKFTSLVAQMVKNLPAMRETQVPSLGLEDPLEKSWLPPTPVLLPREFHGQRSLKGHSPWGHKESDTTEQLTHKFKRNYF